MKTILLLLLLCQPTLQPIPKNGSVIFFDSGPFTRIVVKTTDSTLTHTAIVLYEDDQPWVYESAIPRVVRIPWDQYLSQNSGKKWFVMEPCVPYSVAESNAMKEFADSQLDRRYMVRGWWMEREVRGIFCSEYVGDILEKSGRIISDHYRESPGSLYKKLDFYETSFDKR